MYLYCFAVEAGFYSDIVEFAVRSVGSQSLQKSLRVYSTSLKSTVVFIEHCCCLLTKHNSIRSKALSMPLTVWKFVYQYHCIGGKWAVTCIWLPVFATRYVKIKTDATP